MKVNRGIGNTSQTLMSSLIKFQFVRNVVVQLNGEMHPMFVLIVEQI